MEARRGHALLPLSLGLFYVTPETACLGAEPHAGVQRGAHLINHLLGVCGATGATAEDGLTHSSEGQDLLQRCWSRKQRTPAGVTRGSAFPEVIRMTFNPSGNACGELLPTAGAPPPQRNVASLTNSWSLQLVPD